MHYTLCDFILDIVQNSVEAGSSLITVEIAQEPRTFSVRVGDDGRGMTPEELERATDPFVTDGVKHRNRKIGLGLSFLSQAIEAVNGVFQIASEKGRGTEIFFSFPADHLDTPPVGDIPSTLLACLGCEGDCEIVIRRSDDERGLSYGLSRKELEDALGTLEDSGSLLLLREYLVSQESGENA